MHDTLFSTSLRFAIFAVHFYITFNTLLSYPCLLSPLPLTTFFLLHFSLLSFRVLFLFFFALFFFFFESLVFTFSFLASFWFPVWLSFCSFFFSHMKSSIEAMIEIGKRREKQNFDKIRRTFPESEIQEMTAIPRYHFEHLLQEPPIPVEIVASLEEDDSDETADEVETTEDEEHLDDNSPSLKRRLATRADSTASVIGKILY